MKFMMILRRVKAKTATPPAPSENVEFDTTQELTLNHWKSAGWVETKCRCNRQSAHVHLSHNRKQPSSLVISARSRRHK